MHGRAPRGAGAFVDNTRAGDVARWPARQPAWRLRAFLPHKSCNSACSVARPSSVKTKWPPVGVLRPFITKRATVLRVTPARFQLVRLPRQNKKTLATVATETKKARGLTITVERIRITDGGQNALAADG